VPDAARQEKLRHALQHRLLVGDGGMGARLHGEGVPADQALELLNVTDPARVRAAHEAFLEAGSDVIQTNTFQGSAASLAKHDLAARAAELNRAGAALARDTAGDRAHVAGSVGPTGQLLAPYGDLSAEDACVAFSEQVTALAEGGADLLLLETFFSLEEALCATQAAVATGLPVVVGMAFDPGGHTSFGVSPEQAAESLPEAGATLVGANCGTISPADMVEIISRFRAATSLPLFAQPNAGRPQQTPSGVVYPEGPESLAEAAARFRELGATLIGGCDGATPAHIRAVVQRLRAG
jgi:methionine synthase I (cobalamin-dependent)